MRVFESKVTIEARAPEFAGVRFVLRKMTEGRRIRLRMQLAAAQARIHELMDEQKRLAAEVGAATVEEVRDPEAARQIAKLTREMADLADNEMTPTWVRWGLASIEGLEIDGEPATVESLIESGPPDLYQEVAEAVRKEAGLTAEEQGESGSPTTSPAPGDGRTSNTGAGPASESGSTSEGTASDTSPAT
jgi:hypothetical protein